MNIGDTVGGATAGSILWTGANGVLSQDNANLFWDGANRRLGVGTNAPAARFHLRASTADSTANDFQFVDSTGASILNVRNDAILSLGSGTMTAQLSINSSNPNAGIFSPTYATNSSNILTFKDFNGNVKGKNTAAGSWVLGAGASLVTTATDGFVYIPNCAGAPTGVPTAQTGTSPIVFDTTNNKIWIYNGTWKGVVIA